MLRGNVGLTFETSHYGNVGFGLSHVTFPSGVIHSTQPYLMCEYPFHSLLGAAGGGGLVVGCAWCASSMPVWATACQSHCP
jgi:hypothetical protein